MHLAIFDPAEVAADFGSGALGGAKMKIFGG
jgi:hypothetical protein